MKGNRLTNVDLQKRLVMVNGTVIPFGSTSQCYSTETELSVYILADGGGCLAAKTISQAQLSVPNQADPQPIPDAETQNNITLQEIKLVDQQFIRQKLNQAAQALANITPWNAAAITNAYGTIQGSTSANSFFSGQVTSAGLPQMQSTYNTGQPSMVQTNYSGQCPAGYYVSGITAGNGVTCATVTGTSAANSQLATLNSTQVTAPTPSLQTQVTSPAFAASVPSQPTASGALSPTSTIAPSSYDALTQQVELNSELLTYQVLFGGLASDNSYISSNGSVGGARRQITLAFPISVTPFAKYKGAVAEVRVFMLPTKPHISGTDTHDSTNPPLSVVNLLPASNTYNVAKAATNTKQFGAGVTLDLIGVGATGGKTKSTLYLAKDSDTTALQYTNPIAGIDKDSKRPITMTFRSLLPMGPCDATSQVQWLSLADKGNNYDLRRAIAFGWQFKPVLGNQDVLPINRLFFAQVALEPGTDRPVIYVETRWRAYDRQTGVVGRVYKDSCSWKYFGPAKPLQYASAVAYLKTDDLGGGNLRVTASGYFTDPNLQVRMGNANRQPDFIAHDLGSFEFFTTANTFVSSPNFESISEGGSPVPLVTVATPGQSCALDADTVDAEATPYSDGTATVSVHLNYDRDRDLTNELPLVLFGSDVYGLHDHPFLLPFPDETIDPQHRVLRFAVKMDALTADPAVTVKDVNWAEAPITKRIRIGPTFTALQPLSSSVPGGTGDASPTPIRKGLYRVAGTGFNAICPPNPDQVFDCLALSYPETGKETSLDTKHFQLLNGETARIALNAVPRGQITLLWTNDDGQKTEWVLTTKTTPSAPTAIKPDKSLRKGDSLSVVFSGRDFSSVSTVSFEDTNLTVLAKDTKSLTVMITTKVTASIGSKDLIAIGADGKPIVLPLTVIAQ